jgi:hypothetical protein
VVYYTAYKRLHRKLAAVKRLAFYCIWTMSPQHPLSWDRADYSPLLPLRPTCGVLQATGSLSLSFFPFLYHHSIFNPALLLRGSSAMTCMTCMNDDFSLSWFLMAFRYIVNSSHDGRSFASANGVNCGHILVRYMGANA